MYKRSSQNKYLEYVHSTLRLKIIRLGQHTLAHFLQNYAESLEVAKHYILYLRHQRPLTIFNNYVFIKVIKDIFCSLKP